MEESCQKNTEKTIKLHIDEIYSNGLKKNNNPNETHVYHIDSLWRLDVLDLKDYCPENNKKCKFVLVVIDSFGKFGWILAIGIKVSIT